MRRLLAALGSVVLLLASPLLIVLSWLTLTIVDALWLLRRQRRPAMDSQPDRSRVSIVIPNWNGRDLLERYLPSVVAAIRPHPGSEVVVVDNASSDGSAEFVRSRFPEVRLLELPENRGFGGGSNAGVAAAASDIVVLLNSDMRVDPGFVAPLLEGFADPLVFAVSCQIFFSDPARRREETGLTQGRWENGQLRVRHRVDDAVEDLFPCFYPGGGSSAIDRRKFLELGGFDELYTPFYLEDADLGYQAWKRGWKVLYQPRSIVYHEHRGTIGKKFSDAYIQSVLKKNFLLFAWKNIHAPGRLAAHLGFSQVEMLLTLVFGPSLERVTLGGLWGAFRSLPQAMRSRRRARELAVVDDREAFARPLGGYFRDRFGEFEAAGDPLNVLFVSPYPICPPVHGGGVFMLDTLEELARWCRVHVVALLERPEEREAHRDLAAKCASAAFLEQPLPPSQKLDLAAPHAVEEFASPELEWVMHRQIYNCSADVVQLEYTSLAQYACDFRRIVTVLFEHDVYFQSVGRSLGSATGLWNRLRHFYEYLRALRFETRALRPLDRIQVCSEENGRYLASFAPNLAERIEPGLRAGIRTRRFQPVFEGREPKTMLFLGSFRHTPNRRAVEWFAGEVLPLVLVEEPAARLVVVGSVRPAWFTLPGPQEAIEFRGFVEDVREPLGRYAVFVCPILDGSGIRVKLLEAFAAGIPVVSTTVGAEGLTGAGACLLADTPGEFAARIVDLFRDPGAARRLAERARAEVEAHWDMEAITRALVESYRRTRREKLERAGLRSEAAVETARP
jgi:O-antigen biosynthesis protein